MLIHTTTSLCRVCKTGIQARVVERPDGTVWMEKHCPGDGHGSDHGDQAVMISSNAAWYRRTRAVPSVITPPRNVITPVQHGCPFDCGICHSHAQRVRLPVVTITSACNLDCPICYVHNKNDDAYHMGRDEFLGVIEKLRDELTGDIDLINLTGGEPTMHPQILEFLALAKQAGVHRVSLCSNGLRMARDEAFVEQLAALGARVALSFDTFDRDADHLLQGAHVLDLKLRCLELLAKHHVDVTLIPVMTRGVNDHEIGRILELGLRYPNIRHIEVHTITYTGQSGSSFQTVATANQPARAGRISLYEVIEAIETTTNGLLRPTDYVSSPCAHPLCYQIAYLLLDSDGGPPIPLTRLIPADVLYECLGDHLYIEPSRKLEEAMLAGVERLWAESDHNPDAERALKIVKRLLADVFPSDRSVDRDTALRVLEQAAKAVYIHSHMDEETFDVERLIQCCDNNCYADGRQIPVCAYNVLYREREAHFVAAAKPFSPTDLRGGQRIHPSLPIIQ